jgi:protein-S-isoprenylcysteine O-methyltransferase Ste14
LFVVAFLFPAFDHRFGWSPVPVVVTVIGNMLVVLSFVIFFFVLKANSYAASTIRVEEGQPVISSGPYALVRHPMYTGALVLLTGIPLALGSWWGVLLIVPFFPVLVWRLLDEEQFLHRNLPGYTEYTFKVRYRLVPHVW